MLLFLSQDLSCFYIGTATLPEAGSAPGFSTAVEDPDLTGQLQADQCSVLQQGFGTDNPHGITDSSLLEPCSVWCLKLKSEVSLAWGIFTAVT